MKPTDNFDLLERFSKNAKKEKISTVILIGVLCIFAFCIILLAMDILKKNEKIKQQTEEIKEQIKTIKQQEIDIDRASYVIDSLNTGIIICQSSLDNTVKNMDNTLEFMNRQITQATVSNYSIVNNSSDNTPIVNRYANNADSFLDGTPPMVGSIGTNVSSNNTQVNNSSTQANRNISIQTKINPQLYIQYMPGFEGLEKTINQSLSRTKKYRIPPSEKITAFTFNHQVRYFNDSDKSTAENITEIIKRNTSIKIEAVKINLNAPTGQIEIWIGEKRQLNAVEVQKRNEAIIQQFNLEKK